MQYFTIQARSNREAIEKMKPTYGEDARILTHRSVRIGGFLGMFAREGVEVTGYLSDDGAQEKEGGRGGREEAHPRNREKGTKPPGAAQGDPGPAGIPGRPRHGGGRADAPGDDLHPSLAKMEDLLAANDFSEEFIAASREQREEGVFPGGPGELPACSWPPCWDGSGRGSRSISRLRIAGKGTRILIIVGPDGRRQDHHHRQARGHPRDRRWPAAPRKVRIITIDNYRIAAKQQIETYAEIMRIPVSLVESAADLQKCLALNQDAELILMDTIGRSPRDLAKLAEMKEILAACGSQASVYLALAATTKASDTEEILQQFEPFGYRAVVLTKLDETMRIGNIIRAFRGIESRCLPLRRPGRAPGHPGSGSGPVAR